MDIQKMFNSLATFGDSSFPAAAFIVEKGAEKDKNGRPLQKFLHLPHHNRNVKSPTENSSIDIPHLRNALARANQVKPIKENASGFHKRAQSHLQSHARVLLKTNKSKASLTQKEKDFSEFCDSIGLRPEEE